MVKTHPVPWNKEEMDALVECAADNDFYYVLFMLAKTTGRRLGEYLDVRVKDIDFNKGIMVTKILKRRMKVEKEAILTDEVSKLLRLYIIRKKLDLDSYLFREVSKRQIQNKIKYYGKKSGVKKNVMFHNFRHYFITEMVRKGWSYDKIAKLTGHSSIGTLAVYDHAVAHDIKKEALIALKDI